MRFLKALTFAAAVISLVACGEPSDAPTIPDIPPLAYVRYINAVPDTLNTTVRFIDQVQYSPMTFVNVPFRGQGLGNYQPTQAGSRKLRVFTADAVSFLPAANTVILVDTTLSFEAGKYYTLLHAGFARVGSSPKQRLVVLNDVPPASGANVSLRAINAGYGLGALDVYKLPSATAAIAGSPLFPSLAVEGVSAYQSFSPGAFAAAVAGTGSATAVASAAAPAGAAGTADFIAIGGATIAGSALTAVAFPASPANSAGAKFTAPGVVFFLDFRPQNAK